MLSRLVGRDKPATALLCFVPLRLRVGRRKRARRCRRCRSLGCWCALRLVGPLKNSAKGSVVRCVRQVHGSEKSQVYNKKFQQSPKTRVFLVAVSNFPHKTTPFPFRLGLHFLGAANSMWPSRRKALTTGIHILTWLALQARGYRATVANGQEKRTWGVTVA